MKSKRNQYLLLALVVLIWSLVIYRFLSVSDTEENGIGAILITKNQEPINVKKENYAYRLNYRDPFLKESGTAPSRQNPVRYDHPALRTKQIIPDIKFTGVVTSDNRTTGILQIENKSHIVSEGDEIDHFKVKSIQMDRLFIYFIPLDSSFYLTR